MTRSPDTHLRAHELQLAIYRRLSPARKVEIAAELSEAVRDLAAEGIRQRHPEYDEQGVRRALITLLYGVEVARRLWPGASVLAP